MGVKLGTLDISSFKVGSADCKVYLGETLLYPTTFNGKWKATYADTSVVTADCDASSAINQNEIDKTNLVEVEIGDCVTSISDFALYRCTSLTSCTIGIGVTSIGYEAFERCSSLTSIDIPDSVTSIGSYAFQNCSGMTTCTIGSGVTSIGDNAFKNCNGITSIVIPNSVTSIGSSVFDGCSGITSIDIPSGVTSIGYAAFGDCSGLTSVTVNATTPPTLGNTAFNGSSCPIYVPAESVAAYQSASIWRNYASRIQAIPSLQWVSFSSGDTIPSGNIYGFSGDSQTVGHTMYNILEIGTDSNNCVTFGHGAPTRAPQFTAYFYLISNGSTSYIDSWEGGGKTFVFSDYSSQGVEEYYYEDGTKTLPFDCQLYIYA